MSKPLEWWEHQQLNILQTIGFGDAEVAHLRANPEEWRKLRDEISRKLNRENSSNNEV
jgi:hypothetical protein